MTCPDCLLRIGLPDSEGDSAVEIEGYEIIEELGEGGMGVVYLAEQQVPVTRMVAVKVIKLGMDTRALVERFGSERQALALMEHTNIAAVYDAGATAAGRPYFAMEWVDGQTIDKYCDAFGAGIRERLELFLQVAAAVQHAHSKGIVHCDLKPSNVLVAVVDGVAVPKVIDFGVARAIDPEAKLGQTRFTANGQQHMVGTPAYMAPEQAEGSTQDVDTRADVYSLGAMLYELLSQTPPFSEQQLSSGGVVEMLRVLREEVPEKPSVRAAGQKISPDLDWIVLRAMEKDRERRYPSAGQLADDVRRFLDDEPVVARPPSHGYRLAKFAKRHRIAITIGALVGLALAIATAVSIVQAVRAHRAEVEAIARREQSELLVKFMLQELYGSLKDLGRLDLLSEVADAAIQYYDSLPSEDTVESLVGRSSALAKISEVRAEQGDYDASLEVARMAFDVIAAASESPGADSRLRFEAALRHAQIGMSVRRLEGPAASLPHLDHAIAIGLELVALDGENSADHKSFLAGFYNILGSSYRMLGDHEQSLEILAKSRSLREALLDADPDEVVRLSDVAEIYGDIARVHSEAGDYEKGLELIDEAIAIREQIPKDRPGELRWRAQLASTHFDVARYHRRAGKRAPAIRAIDRAIAVWRQLVEEEGDNLQWRSALANCLQEKVSLAIEDDRAAETLNEAKESLALWQVAATQRTGPRERLELVRSHFNLGRVLLATGDEARAVADFKATITQADQMIAEEKSLTPRTLREVKNLKSMAEKALSKIGGSPG